MFYCTKDDAYTAIKEIQKHRREFIMNMVGNRSENNNASVSGVIIQLRSMILLHIFAE